MKRALPMLFALLSACSIRQTVMPVAQPSPTSVCVAENTLVSQASFLPALVKAFEARGVRATVIPADYRHGDDGLITTWDPAAASHCDMVATYNAQWRWDATMYLVLANVRLYQDGAIKGDALYDASGGGFRFDKWVSAEAKLGELLDRLLPPR